VKGSDEKMDNIIQKPLVSIIIPIYNVENYIRKCIDSVISQTCKDIEIICVNDGTTDNSMSIVERHAEVDRRIKIVNISNSGLSIARNVGMDNADGKYICFLDSDDSLAQDAIEKLVEKAEFNETDILFFGAECIFENEYMAQKQSSYKNYYERNAEYSKVYTGEELFIKMINSNDFKPSACLMLINREYINKLQIRFYPKILHEDNLFTILILKQAGRAMVMDMPFYKRLVREGSITSTERCVKRAYGLYVCNREIMEYVQHNECSKEFFIALLKYLNNMRKNAIKSISNLDVDCFFDEMEKEVAEEKYYFAEYVYHVRDCGEGKTNFKLSKMLHKIENVYIYYKKNGIKVTWRMLKYRMKQKKKR